MSFLIYDKKDDKISQKIYSQRKSPHPEAVFRCKKAGRNDQKAL
jgi:hypothetical protein